MESSMTLPEFASFVFKARCDTLSLSAGLATVILLHGIRYARQTADPKQGYEPKPFETGTP